jgi:hypothetical protein
VRRLGTWAALILVVVVVAVIAASCHSGSKGSNGKRPSPTGSATATGTTAQAGLQQYLTAPPATPVATVDGTIKGTNGDITAHADILAVDSGPRSAVLRWRLRTDQVTTQQRTDIFMAPGHESGDTSGVALIDTATGDKLLPGYYVMTDLTACTCSFVPEKLGPAGVQMSAVYPPLAVGTASVQVAIPGFRSVSVPVTRVGS